MANILMLAVAGAGKTTYLVNQLNEDERFLIVTYTINNVANIRRKIIRRFGYFPANITLLSYYRFLYHECFLPFSKLELCPTGICWQMPADRTRYLGKDKILFYETNDRILYHNRIAKYCLEFHLQEIKERLEKYFDHFYIDEVQDLAGHDFDFIHAIFPLQIDALLVGDYFQHTYDTSADGNLNSGLYKVLKSYLRKWNHVTIDSRTLSKSYRCTRQVCEFVTRNIGVDIDSHRDDDSRIFVIDSQEAADAILADSNIMKLVYQKSYNYSFKAMNWGASKGLDDFEDVCVILNKTVHKHYKTNTLHLLAASSRNKLYVACTRAHRHLYILSEEYAANYCISN